MFHKADVIEAQTFLYKYADIETIDLLIADTNGVLRGKRVKRDALAKVYLDGVALPGSVFGLTTTGETAENTGTGLAEGEADRVCWPITGTLRPVPWQSKPHAQVLLGMCETDGRPFFADGRQVLARVVERFTELELTPVVAAEMEFYLIAREYLADGAPQPPRSPRTGLRDSQQQVFGIGELEAYDELFDAILAATKAQDLPAATAVRENAPGQYEINLQHVDDPLAAADHAVMLKRLIKALAERHDLHATFMAKPYAERAGNGLHIHLSLIDAAGANMLRCDDPLDNALLRHAIAGLATTMAEGMALFAPNANSYRRFRAGAHVPLSPTWGMNNRTVALRIPAGPTHARRVEHRVAGADANPYLALAAVLAGVHHGITNHLEPPPPIVGNAYAQRPPSLPATWQDALHALDQATVLPRYLGADFCRLYGELKSYERQVFENHITALEYAWYLHTV